jgi:hypothetical protein
VIRGWSACTTLAAIAAQTVLCQRCRPAYANAYQRDFRQVKGAAAGQTVPYVRFHVVSLRAAEPLKPHAAQPAGIALLRIVANRIMAGLARQE